jgi:hypothetical protein
MKRALITRPGALASVVTIVAVGLLTSSCGSSRQTSLAERHATATAGCIKKSPYYRPLNAAQALTTKHLEVDPGYPKPGESQRQLEGGAWLLRVVFNAPNYSVDVAVTYFFATEARARRYYVLRYRLFAKVLGQGLSRYLQQMRSVVVEWPTGEQSAADMTILAGCLKT